MISNLLGSVRGTRQNPDRIVLRVGGVGYEVHVSEFLMARIVARGIVPAELVEMHITTVVREDRIALFGFLDLGEREMFEFLMSVPQMGATSAMRVLSRRPWEELRDILNRRDNRELGTVKGIGPKSIEAILKAWEKKAR